MIEPSLEHCRIEEPSGAGKLGFLLYLLIVGIMALGLCYCGCPGGVCDG